MPIEDADLPELTVLLSPERLAALSELTGNLNAAIERHQETLRLGTTLMCVIPSIEISLRNAVCENLGQHFAAPGWLINPPASFRWKDTEKRKIIIAQDSARRSEYSKLSQTEKHALDGSAFPNGMPEHISHLERAKARRSQIHVSDGKVIAELTFYIWKRLYGPDYEHTLWNPTLKKTFPYKKIKRSKVAIHLETLYQTRNRLAHHEPVLHKRFRDAEASVNFIAMHLQATSPGQQTPLYRLISDEVLALNQQAQILHAKLDSFRN